jgi:hypothetical protein
MAEAQDEGGVAIIRVKRAGDPNTTIVSPLCFVRSIVMV